MFFLILILNLNFIFADKIIELENFNSYKNTSEFLDTWKSRSKYYKNTLEDNSYYYYIKNREDKNSNKKDKTKSKNSKKDKKHKECNKILCSALRMYPKDFKRKDIEEKDIKMTLGTKDKLSSVGMYKDYWNDPINFGKRYHNKGKEVFLEWEWMAKVLPTGADEEKRKISDSAMSVYVVLYLGWYRFRIIKYTWSATEKKGLLNSTKNLASKRTFVIRNKNDKLNTWYKESVNVSKVIKEFLPKNYTSILFIAVSVMADSDDFKHPSSACVDNMKLRIKDKTKEK
jgi:hypothetical protein